jgi:hypothetical protein
MTKKARKKAEKAKGLRFEQAFVALLKFAREIAYSGCACGGAKGMHACFSCDALKLLHKLKLQEKQKKFVGNVTARVVPHGESLQWLCDKLGPALERGEIEGQRFIGHVVKDLENFAGILEHFGYPEASKKIQHIAAEEIRLEKMCDVPMCTKPMPHSHCNECGSTKHGAAHCTNED